MSVKKEHRTAEIIRLIAQQQKADVAELSRKLAVSQVTIRKDLDELERKGLIKRQHGFAQINDSDNIAARLAYHFDEKMKIAEKAVSLIENGDTVMIENGSCCALLARVTADTRENVTIVTNSVYIAEYIRGSASTNVVLLGGIYQQDSECLVGPMIRDTAENYNVKYFFAGSDGWSERTGFTNKDSLRAQAVRDMSHSCENMVILTESAKFLGAGTVPMNIKRQPKLVITDSSLSKETVATLNNAGIEVRFA